jgi:hypothetical protein
VGWVVVLIGLVFALLQAAPHKTEGEKPTEDGGSRQHAVKRMDDA